MKCNKPTLNDDLFHLRLFLRYKYYYGMERFTNYWDHKMYEVAILHLMHALKAFDGEKNTINFMEEDYTELGNMYKELKSNIDKSLKTYNFEKINEDKILKCPKDCEFCYYKKVLSELDVNNYIDSDEFLKNDDIYDIPLLTVFNCAKQMKRTNEKKEKKDIEQKTSYFNINIFKKFRNIFNK
uniref:PIR Superfamily Protein n=1 Tax=Parastrongyloides trichosuri TaxID=131310 RepID=A0A0N4ZHR9_PARTI